MQRLLLFFLGLLLCGTAASGQPAPADAGRQVVVTFQPPMADTDRIAASLRTGSYYLYKPGRFPGDLDSALVFFTRARDLADTIKNTYWQNEAQARLGDYYYEKDDREKGKSAYIRVIDFYRKAGNKAMEKHYQDRLLEVTGGVHAGMVPDNIQYFEAGGTGLASKGGQLQNIAAHKEIAYACIKAGELDKAEKELLGMLAAYNALHYDKLVDTYELLAEVSKLETDLHKELLYKLELIKNMEATGDTARADYFYSKLALTYADLNMHDQSQTWIFKAMDVLIRRHQLEDYYGYVSLAVWNFNVMNKPEEGIAFLKRTAREVPPLNAAQRVDLYEGYGNCYANMQQYAKAEQYYLEMMRLYKQTSFNQAFYSTNYQMTTDYIHYNQVIGNFYVLTKQYAKAGAYFGKILGLPKGTVRPVTLSKINRMQFTVDSARGNYIAAIQHFETSKNIDDSLFNDNKSKQIEELEISYQTEKKDKELQTKQKNIVQLVNKNLLQDARLREANLIRNVIIISSLLLIALLYTGYRFKQRHNIQLQVQQRVINSKNQRLEQVLAEQQKLLAQKEWLVREIHHRVKNNLQIVISLLNVQAGFLNDPSAVEAIRESRERMQAIAIIHQKLYQPDSSTRINLRSYIQEMVIYLRSSFSGYEKISFQLDVEELNVDVSQAVPLGIIINEAITNSVKYAFPIHRKGRIVISVHQFNGDEVLLRIKDNGQGFPDDFDLKDNNSLGIQLMKLFAEQLEAALSFRSHDGAEISLRFKSQQTIDPVEPDAFANIQPKQEAVS
ncbi:hypothetical protein DCC81_15990 [Chitinophaga parva]|uniref:Histidine kinase/HSP90-like ATPase domain-containing protein n=1 Tax=Chitinophaga parva TaxID=2169414 RepID=A0A2T7BHK9_9BACT|nr:sensor histidine kinase [Chitinophaga parva]PUZ25764.1 hypothetical protein DCC81_15990 [Chitinophaga parva]